MIKNSNNDYKSYKLYKNYIPCPEVPGNSGGYKSLAIFKQAEIIQDFTVEFTSRYIEKKSRTKDQMDQASRSSKQCIAEGYLQKSIEGRIKMLGVSRGSYEELLNDYLDYLRQHHLLLWNKNSPEAKKVRDLVYKNYKIYNGYKNYIPSYKDYQEYLSDPELAANAMVCLINQTNQLLDQKLRWTEEKFIKEGGFRENLFKKRLDYRRREEEKTLRSK